MVVDAMKFFYTTDGEAVAGHARACVEIPPYINEVIGRCDGDYKDIFKLCRDEMDTLVRKHSLTYEHLSRISFADGGSAFIVTLEWLDGKFETRVHDCVIACYTTKEEACVGHRLIGAIAPSFIDKLVSFRSWKRRDLAEREKVVADIRKLYETKSKRNKEATKLLMKKKMLVRESIVSLKLDHEKTRATIKKLADKFEPFCKKHVQVAAKTKSYQF